MLRIVEKNSHGVKRPLHPQLVFYAKGPDFREHVMLEHARLVDEAPTFAELLGLEFPNVQGSCLWELLKKDHSGKKNNYESKKNDIEDLREVWGI